MTAIRTPQLTGIESVTELATKVQGFAEDVVRALGLVGSLDLDIRTVQWAEDGNAKQVLTGVRRPVIALATAKESTGDTATVATGSVSFHVTGRAGGLTDVRVTDVSGLTSGTEYTLSVLFVGEV